MLVDLYLPLYHLPDKLSLMKFGFNSVIMLLMTVPWVTVMEMEIEEVSSSESLFRISECASATPHVDQVNDLAMLVMSFCLDEMMMIMSEFEFKFPIHPLILSSHLALQALASLLSLH